MSLYNRLKNGNEFLFLQDFYTSGVNDITGNRTVTPVNNIYVNNNQASFNGSGYFTAGTTNLLGTGDYSFYVIVKTRDSTTG